MRAAALLVALLAGAAPAGSAPSLSWRDLFGAEDALEFAPGEARRPLAHPFVQFASEVVLEGDSALVRNRDYGIDYVRGVLFLLRRPEAPRRLAVRYLFLPGPRQRSFRAVTIATRAEALGDDAAADPRATAPAVPPPDGRTRPDLALPPRLQLSGSKTIGVAFGRNREASIDQSLRVEVSGELGDDLNVNAVLADDDLPVVPEGNTEELGDLSKVFVEMQGPVVGGVLGDHVLEAKQGEFIDLRRDLRGAEVRLRHGGTTGAAGLGLARGEFANLAFRGSEGRQGPYELLSARRLEFSTVLPGSERVYLDGQPMKRGDNQDYVIDYDRGELRFTSRRRITADSEIAVDFQVSSERYRRTTQSARLGGTVHGVRLRALVLEEGDDPERPVGAAYGPAEVAALRAAGDAAAIAPGIRAVEAGKGLYRWSADSSFVRYDPAAGDLEVTFYETPSGAYEDSLDALTGRRVFAHAGAGRGHFAIGRLLAPPGRHRLVSGVVEASPWSGARLAGEFSLSGFDKNRLSATGDDDNLGEAADLALDGGALGLGRAGRLGAAAHVAQLSSRFRAPGRARPPYYYKEWNAETDTLHGTERLAETTLSWDAGGEKPWARAAANLGRLDRGEALVTDRAQLDLGLGRDADRGVDLRLQSLATQRSALGDDIDRTRRFARAGGRWRFGPVRPEVLVERDAFVRADADSQARPSYRYLDLRWRLGFLDARRATVALEVGRRDTDARRTAVERAAGLDPWKAARRNDTVALDLFARPGGAWSAEVGLSRRTNAPRGDEPVAATRADLARLLLAWTPPERAARVEWRYDVSNDAVRTLQQVLVLAPDGKGDYDAEGDPVGRDQGLYDKVYRTAGEAERVVELEASLRCELGGSLDASGPDSSAGWLRRNVSLLQYVTVKEQARGAAGADLYLLDPGAFQKDRTVFGTFLVRQEWSLLNTSPRDALRLFLEGRGELDGRFAGNRIRGRNASATLRWDRAGTSRWSRGVEGSLARRRRQGGLDAALPGRPGTGSYDVRSTRFVLRNGWRLSPSERLAVDGSWQGQRDEPSGIAQDLWTLAPQATLAPVRNVRILATVAVARVEEERAAGALPPFFFDAPGTRTTASLTGSYRLGQNLNLNLSYVGVRQTDGRSTYDVKAETRAIF